MLEDIDAEQPEFQSNSSLGVIWLGPLPLVFVFKAEAAEVVVTNNKTLLEKSWLYDFYKPWLGDGILVA